MTFFERENTQECIPAPHTDYYSNLISVFERVLELKKKAVLSVAFAANTYTV